MGLRKPINTEWSLAATNAARCDNGGDETKPLIADFD
jgi:hypothetical protein